VTATLPGREQLTSTSLLLPQPDGSLERYRLHEPREWPRRAAGPRCRVAFAAAHVVADPLSDTSAGAPAMLDWDATLAFRRHLWSYGLAVADAMDTAQRGMGLTWQTAGELIQRSAAEARSCGGRLAVGVGTDHAAADLATTAAVRAAYEEQLEVAQAAGASAILMASRQLARVAGSAQDYLDVYGDLLRQVSSPVIVHWLGPAFDPALTGYWGHTDLGAASEVLLEVIQANADRIDGVKISLLDADREIWLRERVPAGVKVYTGDDFHYPELILGDARGFSHALLGILDPIAPVAAAALDRLDEADEDGYRALLAPTVPLARHLFAAPTWNYKVGIVFLAWLAGHQPAFSLVGGLTSGRSLVHLAQALRLADQAGLLPDPDLAAERMGHLLAVNGIRA
jgi:Protein of unknown function (DUF993)